MMARQSPPVLFYSAILVAALACIGCGGEDASKEIDTLHSWRATIDLASDARLRGWVTPRYASQLDDEGRQALSKGDQLAANSRLAAIERDSLRAAGASLRASLARLARTGR